MNALELRRRTLGKGVYKKTVEGNPAIAQGSLARRYPGITMQGWTEQNGTPTPEAPVPIVSAGTQNQDTGKWEYEVKLTGANLFDYTDMLKEDGYIHSNFTTSGAISIKPFHVEQGKQYLLITKGSAVVTTDYSSIYFGQDDLKYIDDGATTKVLRTDIGYGAFRNNEERRILLTASRTCEITKCMVHGASPSERYQVEEFGLLEYTGDINIPYEPYRTPQTVLLTADRPLTKWDKLEKRNGQWGWVYKSNEIVLDGSEDENWILAQTDNYNQFYIKIDTVEHSNSEKNIYCEKFRSALIADRETEKEIIYTVYAITGCIAVSTELATEVDTWKTWLQSNPIRVLYKSTEETFVPLSESEQEQMNALHTFRPTTVLSNDCGCNMTLTYKTKKSLEVTD